MKPIAEKVVSMFPIKKIIKDFHDWLDFEGINGTILEIREIDVNESKFISLNKEDQLTIFKIAMNVEINQQLSYFIYVGLGTFSYSSTTGIFDIEKAILKMEYNEELNLLGVDIFYSKMFEK